MWSLLRIKFLDLIDHLHDLEQLHQRLVHMFWVLTKTKIALVLRLLNKNLKVDAVAGLFDGTKELGIVLRLHMVLHHFHLRMNKYNARAQKYFVVRFPNPLAPGRRLGWGTRLVLWRSSAIEIFNSLHLTLDPELHQLAVRRSQCHRCHLRLLGTQLGGEIKSIVQRGRSYQEESKNQEESNLCSWELNWEERLKALFREAELLKYSISLVESSTGKEEGGWRVDQIWKNKVTCSTSSVRRHIRIFQYSISSCLSKALVDALEDGDGAVKFIVKTKPVVPGRRSLVSVARFQTAAP